MFSSAAPTLPPLTASRYAAWAQSASSLLARDGFNTWRVLPELRRLRTERPTMFAAGVAVAAGTILAAGIAFSLLGLLSTRRTRWLPYEVTRSARATIATRAIIAAWPWSAALGILVGAAVWYVGFDRAGASRTLVEGVVPTLTQAAAVVAVWSTLSTLNTAPFLRSAAAAIVGPSLADAQLCINCRYPVRGHASGTCPECGATIHTPDLPMPRRCHAITARRAATAIAALGLTALIAAASHRSAHAWLRLRPPHAGGYLVLGNLSPSGPTLQLEGVYGRLMLDADHHQAASPSHDGTWLVRWTFTPDARSAAAPKSGSLTIPDRVDPTGRALTFHVQPFPFGEFAFWTYPANPQFLGVGAAAPTFHPPLQ